jgi:MFS family permease
MFRGFHEYSTFLIFVIFLAGMCTAAFYGWFPLYLPELFPTRVRATGQGVSYNSGRIIAAFGAIYSGMLVAYFSRTDGATAVAGSGYAQMGSWITLVYVVGMVTIWLAPETKGKPLPE